MILKLVIDLASEMKDCRVEPVILRQYNLCVSHCYII